MGELTGAYLVEHSGQEHRGSRSPLVLPLSASIVFGWAYWNRVGITFGNWIMENRIAQFRNTCIYSWPKW